MKKKIILSSVLFAIAIVIIAIIVTTLITKMTMKTRQTDIKKYEGDRTGNSGETPSFFIHDNKMSAERAFYC